MSGASSHVSRAGLQVSGPVTRTRNTVMEPQLRHPDVHRYGEDHHHQHLTNLEGEAHEEQQYGEKKSVLEKVKVKAKKVKDTIKKLGHLHGHEHHDEDHEHGGEYEDETEEDHSAPAHKSQFLTNPMEGRQRLDHLSSHVQQTASGKDHVGHGDPPHGLGATGFTGAGNIGRLIIPDEAPLASRNTPTSQYGRDHQPISQSGDEQKKTRKADHEDASTQPKQSSYAGKITSALADKASEAKNMVFSKLGGTQSTIWAEKLRPGNEDKALSQFISGALCNKAGTNQRDAMKGKEEKRLVRERVSDAVHKGASKNDDDDNHSEREVKLMGRVTESEEVARRLGTSEEERRGDVTHVPTGVEAPVRDWIKEIVSSWWTPDRGPQEPAK